MTTIALPHLALTEAASDFDEAVLVIDGREEDTITVDCTDARELAERIALLINHHGEIVGALQAAVNVLRAHEDASRPAHAVIAGGCEILLQKMGVAA